MFFTSDNAGPAAPEIIAAITRANEGSAMPYGEDAIMDSVRQKIRDVFEAPEAAVYLVSTGTAANSLALATMVQPWQTIYCHRDSHVQRDECGAPEFYSGAKLTLLDGDHAKISAESFLSAVEGTPQMDVHSVQRGALTLTNTSEHGGVYSVEEIKALCDIAAANEVPVHMDGARFTNALVTLGCTPAEMTWKAGIQTLSFGGSKNGLVGVEAVILFDPKQAWEFELRRKRGGHLVSKHRFLSAQMDAYLTDGLWLDLAAKANRAAARLKDGILQIDSAGLLHPVEANMIFAKLPRKGHNAAIEAGAKYYHWPSDDNLDENLEARLVCNWATTDAEIDRFVALVAG